MKTRREKTEKFDYDLVLSHIGDFGRFQVVSCIFLCCISAIGGLAVVVFPFTGFVPSHRFYTILLQIEWLIKH